MRIYEKVIHFLKTALYFLVLILADQTSKYLIRTSGGFYICNRGVAFGINIPVLVIYSVILLIFLILIISNYKCQISNQAQSSKSKNFVIWIWDLICHWKFDIWNLAVLFILSGAISNFIDRIYFGCVIDFIDLKFWPVFNLADIYITIGAIVIIKHITYNIKQK